MEMIVPAGMYGTLQCSGSGLNYINIYPGATINVDPADVNDLINLGFTPGAATTDYPTQPDPAEFVES
ncbi:hypothetical protein [Bradyrhizobium sp. Tv2a-2]|uniref:hypothetical protein n=1 Tax=Bradyrhizobium sp. Tv2a-2 TaxID=113395 RepID=UPI000419AB90|nr:hypothetical protein [Bradyrhizobium sp. Tv2a-2]